MMFSRRGICGDAIKRAKRVSVDPWLMASEIALVQVAHAQSTQLRKAQRTITTKTFNNRDVSELAAAIGGTELMHGNGHRLLGVHGSHNDASACFWYR